MPSRRPLIEILYFDGCPNHQAARDLVERATADIGLGAQVRFVNVPDADAADRQRFLGSPTIRVDGRDIEPGADLRGDFVLACRVYRTDRGLAGLPDEAWLRQALAEAPR